MKTRAHRESRFLLLVLLALARRPACGRDKRRRRRPRPRQRHRWQATSPAGSRPTARARSGRTRPRPPSASAASTRASRSRSASRARAAGSSASAAARPTSRTPRGRSRTRRRRSAPTRGSSYVEFQVANDALTVVVNKDNDWATCLTVDQLKTIWEPGSKVENWNQVDPSFPDEKLTLFGPGHRLGHVRLLHRRDQRRGGREPLRLRRQRGRQHDRHRRRRREGRPRLLRLLLLRGEPGQAEGARDRRRRRLRRAERRDRAERHVQAALAAALHLRQEGRRSSGPRWRRSSASSLDNEQEIAEAAQFVPLTDEQLTKAKADLDAAVGA